MSETTAIEWCDSTFNPWTGCTKVSPGCDHCYAESWAKRSGTVQWGPHAARRRTSASNWQAPLHWDKHHDAFQALHGRRRRVFCASLADVFDSAVPHDWRRDLFELIGRTQHLDWLLLTKRIGNAREMLNAVVEEMSHGINTWDERPWPGVWIGATVVNQEESDRDIPKLLQVPARVRFLSIEPMLGGIWAAKWLKPSCSLHGGPLAADGLCDVCIGRGLWSMPPHPRPSNAQLLPAIDWVICGGESGPGARPMHPDWARSLRDQCAAADVHFLFKQWGEWADFEHTSTDWWNGRTEAERRHLAQSFIDGKAMNRIGKKAAGRLLDGVEHNGFPEVA